MAPREAREARHLDFIDGLRAIAVLMVIGFHTWYHWRLSRPAPQSPFSNIFRLGTHGVELFFVISGLCLAYPLLRRVRAGQPLAIDYRRFMARRFVRVFPPFWIALTALVAIAPFAPQLWQSFANEQGNAIGYYYPADTLKEYLLVDGSVLHNPSFWSLCVELRWYFLFPLALWLYIRSPRYLLLLAGASWFLYAKSSLNAIDLQALPAFFLGIVAADAVITSPRWAPWGAMLFPLCVMIGMALPGDHSTRGPVWELAAFGLVLCGICMPWFRLLLAWRPLAFIGIASYSIYLVHEPVIAWLASRGAPPLVAGILALTLGIVFWACIERPLLKPAHRDPLVDCVNEALRRASSWSPWAAASRPPRIENVEAGQSGRRTTAEPHAEPA